MCINYIPTTKAVLVEYFGVDDPGYDWKEEVWQDYQAPILTLHDGHRQALIASYGLVSKRKVQPGSKVSIHRNSIDTGKMRRSSLDPTFLLA
ncbi:hypothetical protein, partial [Aeromonas caviae]|uniref:hypothetical protein n=1 Tax=Aeromonas caviae TaxID=648 RepID=UPI002B4863F3